MFWLQRCKCSHLQARGCGYLMMAWRACANGQIGVQMICAGQERAGRLFLAAVLVMTAVLLFPAVVLQPAFADEQLSSATAAVDSQALDVAASSETATQSEAAPAGIDASEDSRDSGAVAYERESTSQSEAFSTQEEAAQSVASSGQATESEQVEDASLPEATAASDMVDTKEGDKEAQGTSPVFRLYNSLTSEHLYTTSKYEYDVLPGMTRGDWIQEGIAWVAPDEGRSSLQAVQQRSGGPSLHGKRLRA